MRTNRVTGKQAYLDLAKFMLDVRKPDSPGRRAPTYNQSQAPPVDQTEAVGHAVRAVYMYSGMADVAAMTGDSAYLKAIDAIWQDVVGKKLYVTGGIGATGSGEAFGGPYELPNMTAYCETCAAAAGRGSETREIREIGWAGFSRPDQGGLKPAPPYVRQPPNRFAGLPFTPGR